VSAVPFCRSDELGEGQARSAMVGAVPVTVARSGGRVHAVGALCPHKQADLGTGIVRAGTLTCRAHLWEFELATGACRSMPGRSLPTYAAHERDGLVLVDVADAARPAP